MIKGEIFITVKPARMRDVIANALSKDGYKITGTGCMVDDENATGDLWVIPPTGAHPDEFGAAFPKQGE